MRHDEDSEILLSTIGEGAYFGERALLQSEKRYADIRADSQLATMCISRSEFEELFGPLANLIPSDGSTDNNVTTKEDHVKHHIASVAKAVVAVPW